MIRIVIVVVFLGGLVFAILQVFEFEEPAPLELGEPVVIEPEEPETPPASLRLNPDAAPTQEVAAPEPEPEPAPAPQVPVAPPAEPVSAEEQQRVQDLENFFSAPSDAPAPQVSEPQPSAAASSLQRLQQRTAGEGDEAEPDDGEPSLPEDPETGEPLPDEPQQIEPLD